VSYEVILRPSAARSFRKLPSEVQARLKPAIDALAEDPRPHGIDKMSGGEHLYRIRVGDYRIVYEIQDDVLLVLVVGIGHRREIYRKK
jgi:mRNA interferase RelE/StbE